MLKLNELNTAMRTKGYVQASDGSWAKPAIRDRNPGAAPKLESDPRNGTVATVQVQKGVGRRVLVRITSFRRRLLDEDNLCEKFHCDLCRYAGIILGDSPGQAKIEVAQQKVGSKEPEFVRIQVFDIN